jgi:hypothetical protein
MNPFNLPSVDHLTEGVHYRVLDWNFAEDTEANILRNQQTNMPSRGMASTFADGQGCPEGEKMVFGVCRKPGQRQNDDKDFDSSKKTKQEEEGEAQAAKEGSSFKNNKMIKDIKTGKKMGWAMKDGKPVLVEWGSVAGEKKVGPAKPKKPKAPQPAPAGASRSGVTDSTRAGQRRGNDIAASLQVNDAGREAQAQNRRNIESQTRSA